MGSSFSLHIPPWSQVKWKIKIDLRRAYNSIPVHPANCPALGLKWTFLGDIASRYLMDTHLCFWGRKSTGKFHCLMQSVKCMMHCRGFYGIVVYLDDFLVIAPAKAECTLAFDTLLELLTGLSFKISPSKLVSPCQQLTFLGIVIDTCAMGLLLPQDILTETNSWCICLLLITEPQNISCNSWQGN